MCDDSAATRAASAARQASNPAMMLQSIITQFLSGFSVVAILVIASLGLAIIFGVAGVINMAHGEMIMVGAYTAAVVGKLGGNTFIAIPIAFVVVGLLGLVIERGIIQWIYDRPLETLLATWGVGIILQTVIKLVFGPELYYVGAPKILEGSFRLIGRLPFPWYRLFLIVLAVALLAVVFFVIYKTDLGLKVRAVRRNRAISGCLGIDTARVDMMIFVFGSGLAGIAGAILAPIKSVSTTMGFPYAVDSFMVLVLGGVGNLWGVLAGGGLIGEAETVLSFIFNNVIGRLLVFLFIVIMIRIVPRGIFGYYERR
jgi:urea transport system permease protein